MKKPIAIPILCTLLFALLSPSKGDLKFCPTTMQISGSCGPNGAFECFEAINAKYGASAMAQRCSCKDLSASEHLCQCYIVCQ
ncbi:putative defensin-like protein 234 isoform X5 [Gossypium raimondii]|uniref:putative defensin-like protein 234 isoform X5 n=1 Tax=Gossypium raimondii TaxID=29730 RepID=UPI00227ACED3|nr:putative defensin-like protein 234 isoform X5 [Gossypium raimondii]